MKHMMKALAPIALAALLGVPATSAPAQDSSPQQVSSNCNDAKVNCFLKTYRLHNITVEGQGLDIASTLRDTLNSSARVRYVPSQRDLVVYASPQDQAVIAQMLTELDRPTRSFRLTFTITAVDGGKSVGVAHYTMIALAGQRTVMKVGNKVPLLTGSGNNNPQFTFVDVGMNFDVTAEPVANGILLQSKVEQSNATQQEVVNDIREPIIGQTVLEGSSIVVDHKPLMLGSLDVPHSTQHYDISVMEEPLP